MSIWGDESSDTVRLSLLGCLVGHHEPRDPVPVENGDHLPLPNELRQLQGYVGLVMHPDGSLYQPTCLDLCLCLHADYAGVETIKTKTWTGSASAFPPGKISTALGGVVGAPAFGAASDFDTGSATAISITNRAPKANTLIFALAVCAKMAGKEAATAANAAVTEVCGTATHLFGFLRYVKALGGTGSGTRRAIARWCHQ